MFLRVGKVVSAWWPLFLLLWTSVLGLAWWTAPAYKDVVLDREFAFLPETTPSRRAERAFEKAFPQQYHPSSLVLVLRRSDRELSPEDLDFVAQPLQKGLEQLRQEEPTTSSQADGAGSHAKTSDRHQPVVDAIRSFKEPGSGGLLISQDKKATLVILALNSELLEHRNWAVLDKVEALWARLQGEGKVPPGLEMFQTGSAAIGADVTQRQVQSARATEFTTVVVVVVLLILIYRAPILALVPLVTVAVAVEMALKFLSLLAEAGVVTVFEGLQTFITVIVYGSGVDYCLFLIARYREELDDGVAVQEGVANAVGKTGAAVTASAATVTLGIGMMTFAQFGEFHHAGIAIASSLFLSLLAVLTLTPALLRLTGGGAFWPLPFTFPTRKDLALVRTLTLGLTWEGLAAALRRRPLAIWLLSVVLMLPFAIVAVINIDNLEFDLVKRLPATASSLAGIEELKQHFPAGVTGPVIVLIHNPGVDFHEDKASTYIVRLTDRLDRQKKELGIADIRSLARPLGTSDAAQEALDELAVETQLKKQQNPAAEFRKVEDYYIGEGNVTQVQIVLSDDPLARQAVGRLERLKAAVRASLPEQIKDAHLDFLGLTAAVHDLRVVTGQDQWRIEGLVVACVFIVLVILLRQPGLSLYLIGSVLLSFLTTLGATFFLFWLLEPEHFGGLDWKVPIFLFTILVAVGEDYNIFLMTRVHEEQEKHGRVEGVLTGLIKTGRIITSCGIIMAGTFSSLLPGSLVDLKQLGFALAFGVLLDTFVVRPILLPAYLVALESRRK